MEARATDNVLQIRTLGSLGIEEQLTASGQAIIERAENMRIGNAREYEDAAAFLVEIKKRSKQMKEYWKPSKDAAKAAHARICEQEKAMLTGSLFGWEVPGADPRQHSHQPEAADGGMQMQ